MHKTKLPAACSLVEAQRPLKSLHLQDVLEYITYFVTPPPPTKYKSSFSFLYDPLWLLELLWAGKNTKSYEYSSNLALNEHLKFMIYSYITKCTYTQMCLTDQAVFPQLANDAIYSVITVQIRPVTL